MKKKKKRAKKKKKNARSKSRTRVKKKGRFFFFFQTRVRKSGFFERAFEKLDARSKKPLFRRAFEKPPHVNMRLPLFRMRVFFFSFFKRAFFFSFFPNARFFSFFKRAFFFHFFRTRVFFLVFSERAFFFSFFKRALENAQKTRTRVRNLWYVRQKKINSKKKSNEKPPVSETVVHQGVKKQCFAVFPNQSRAVVGDIRKNEQIFSDLNFHKNVHPYS